MVSIKNFAKEMFPLIGVSLECNDKKSIIEEYRDINGKPLKLKRLDGYTILDGPVGFLWIKGSCDKSLGKSYRKYTRYQLSVMDKNRSDSHEVNRNIEIKAKDGYVRNLAVSLEEKNIRSEFRIAQDIDNLSNGMIYFSSKISIDVDDCKKKRNVEFDTQKNDFTTFTCSESFFGKTKASGKIVQKHFRVRHKDPTRLYISSSDDFISFSEDARIAVRGALYHPEINGTIRIVEDTMELAFPGFKNLVLKAFPEYDNYVHRSYEPVIGVHEEIESSIIRECANIESEKALLWVPKTK